MGALLKARTMLSIGVSVMILKERMSKTLDVMNLLDGTHSIFIPSMMMVKVVIQLSSGVMIMLKDLDWAIITFIPTF